MSDVNVITQNESINEEVFSNDSNVEKVQLRAVLTSSQVREVESKKKQPQVVQVELNGKHIGFRALNDLVHPATKAELDEEGRLQLFAPVVGG